MIYAGIDIGSDTIKIVVGRVNDNSFHVLGSVNTRSVGVKKGLIVDKDLVIKSINLALDELEKELGFRPDKAIVNVPFYDVEVNLYNGKCYPDGKITGEDVVTCFKSSVSTIDVDLEVVTVFPIDFLINDEKKSFNPIEEEAHKLESRMLIATVPKAIVYPYLEVLEKCQIEVIDLSFGPVNDFYNMKDIIDLEKGCGAVVDIGKDKTEIAVFNKGLMIDGETIPVGSKLLDHDISYIYHIDKLTSRNLKENFAFVSSKYADNNETVEYTSADGDKIIINQYEISEIIEARLEEILKNVKKSLNTLTKKEISYIIVTGGVSNLSGFDYLINDVFGDIAYTVNMNNLGVRNNIYTSCVGMLKYYYDKLKVRGIDYTMYENISELIADKKDDLRNKIIDDMKKYCDDN